MSDPEQITAETCQHTVEGIYHGRTELGVGQHDKIKTRLNEELHTEYGDYLVKDESDRVRKIKEDGEPQTVYGYESSTGSAADIGFESAMSIVNKRRQLNEDRKAEYEAHLASKAGQTFQQDGSGDASRMSTEETQEESTVMVSSYGSSESFESCDEHEQKQHDYAETFRKQISEEKTITDWNKKKQDFEDERNDWVQHAAQGSRKHFDFDSATVMVSSYGSSESFESFDEREQKQHDYAESLRQQIAEKKTITDWNKKKQDFEDERNDWVQHAAQGSRKHFDFDSASIKGFSGSSQASEQEELDDRSQKQHDYAEALREQIAEKKKITDGVKKKQAFEDERSDLAHVGSQYFNTESRSMKGFSGSSQSSEKDEHDERRQKQQDYAEALRQQIAEKKNITDRIKKRQDFEDERNDRTDESSRNAAHYFNSESPKKTGYPANSEMYGQEELDERRQKQQDYADALRDQIAEKKTITDGIKKKEDEDDEKNQWEQGSSHDYN